MYFGKEKDNESKLGDHGVRKYEYETGRFISIDPLWCNYYGWTPYQYSMNSPVMLVDVGGEKVQELKSKIDATDNEIDLMVYKLYDLTYDEVLIVDPETNISREVYGGNN